MRRGVRRGGPARPESTPIDESGIDGHDERLLAEIDREFAQAALRAGDWLVCGPGCSDCCSGPFAITRLDVGRLRRGMEALEVADPARVDEIRRRAAAAAAALSEGFPGEPASGRLAQDAAKLDRFFERHRELVCPVLDPGSGRCDLYASRPVSCRTYGPPLRFEGRNASPCRLCFAGADPATIESCRYEPDRSGREQALLRAVGVPAGEEWETLVAFAVRGPER